MDAEFLGRELVLSADVSRHEDDRQLGINVSRGPDKAHPEDIAALITDLSMPEMSGADLVRATREIYPQLPVILMTGYIRAP